MRIRELLVFVLLAGGAASPSLADGSRWIGGWSDQLDFIAGRTPEPDPLADPPVAAFVGVLDVEPGDVLEQMEYLRLGARGGEGWATQRGGELSVEKTLSTGWLSPNALGVYTLRDGTVNARFHLGAHGTGLLDMSGGRVENCATCEWTIGYGYGMNDGLPCPALGALRQDGGEIDGGDELWLGRHLGASGVASLDGATWNAGAGTRLVSREILVGDAGVGAIVQSGGTLEATKILMLGCDPGSVGHLTISGGELIQSRSWGTPTLEAGFYLGSEGVGRMTVIGDAARIEIAGVYEQNRHSLLTFALDDAARSLTPIRVRQRAAFAPGAQLRVRFLGAGRPPAGTSFLLLEVTGEEGIDDRGLRLVGPEAMEWQLQSSHRTISVVYRGDDLDGDGVPNASDNCVERANPRQCDVDADGYGNACDGDFDNNGSINIFDLLEFCADFAAATIDPDAPTDANCDGRIDLSLDFQSFLIQFRRATPGASGLPCAGEAEPCLE
jgi:hypothetical protein